MESSIPQHGRTRLGDIFNEDVSELNFLKSKPTCFVIFGKPGSGKTTIAKKLAALWRCELVHGTDIILREMDLGSEIGRKMQEVLMSGEALTTEFVVQLIKEKVASPEVAHYGYVLDGLPSLSDETNSVQQQIEIINNWKLKPDFIINIKVPDIDLNTRRTGIRVDSQTGDEYLKSMWDPPPKVETTKSSLGEEENAEEEELEAEEEEEEEQAANASQELGKDAKERLVHAPENQQAEVEEATRTYKDVTLKLLEGYMADHDRQYLIELDGNFPANVMFQQLMAKLDTFTSRRAIAPIRLQNLEEEELPDEIETEELLRTLASYQMPGPRYRWRRSKWGRLCPVALKEGTMAQGKSDLAVSFLDKMYVLSSVEAMTLFLKNPRPYLMPPLPAPPCKIAVLGAPLAGKTTICEMLADKYKAKVFVMKDLMKERFDEAKAAAIERARIEAVESAIHMVQNKLEQEAIERSEKRRKEAELLKEQMKEEAAIDDSEQAEETADSAAASVAPTDDAAPTDESVQDPVEQHDVMSPVPPVTEENEEVQQMVAEAIRQAEKQEIKLPPEVYVATLKEALERLSEERLAADPDAPKDGGWILDSFPENKEQWAAMIESGIVPDEFVCLADKTQNVEHLRLRYFNRHKEEITEQYRTRLLNEKHAHLKAALEEEAAKKAAALESISENTEEASINEDGEKEPSAKSEVTSSPPPESASRPDDASVSSGKQQSAILMQEISELEKSYIGMPVPDAPEFSKFREICRAFEREWSQLYSAITATVASKPIYVDIQDKPAEEIAQLCVTQIEASFGYRAWDFSGQDLDEEEEDANADDGEEGEEEEDEEASKNKKKHFGYTKHFDPVALKEEFVLWPGNSDIAAKYRERVYYFKTTDSREKFVESPTTFLPQHEPLKPPPPRILILGARGAGKTLQGRKLARELGLFHISFRERLQELILPKTGRKLGPEHEDERLLDKEMSVSVEEAVKKAIEASEAEGAAEEEEEEEEKFDLNDEQEAIKANLVDEEALPVEIISNIVPAWWREEPYRSTGFVLEGFPRTVEEAQFLIQSGLFPDAAIMLMVEDTDVIKRILPPRMDLWKRRRNMQDEKKNSIKKRKKEIRNEKIEARRAELLREQREKKIQAAQAEEEEEEDEEEEDIEEILQMEFEEEEEEEEEEEQEEDASDRMKGEIGENFDDDVAKLQAVQEQFEDGSVIRLEVQASRKPSIVKYLLDIKLKPFLDFRESIFERVYPVSPDVAHRMLMSGYKHPSSFGKWDPVKLLDEGAVIQPMQGLTNPVFPVVYNQYLYFLSSLDSRNKMLANPMQYVFNQPLAKPVVPIQMAILGPPKSGKTTLAERFCKEFGCVRISAGNSIRRVLEQQPESELSRQILSYLHQGGVVPDALTVEAIAVALLDTTTTTRGYILDGFPCTEQQMRHLSKRGILPVKMIELKIDGKEVLFRAERDRAAATLEYPRHDSEGMMIVRHASYDEHSPPIEAFYASEHQNWVTYDARLSKWKLWQTVLAEAKKLVKEIQDYLDRIARGEAARLNDLCISPSEFESHLGCYGHYCPVSLNLRNELVDCSGKSFLEFAVEFRAKYYKLATLQDMKLFLANPEQYVPPIAPRSLPPPHLLPQRRSRDQVKAMFPKQIELNGYCPVTYLDGKLGFDKLVEGSSELVAEYKEKLYSFESEEKLKKFLKLPETYCDLKLPHKLPPKKEPMDISGLPMLGYLEQGAATSIIRSLTAVGCFKPKYPFISVQRSALLYIACHLKAFNPRNSAYIRNKYKKRLADFEDQCRIITYLGDHMTRRYHDPATRPLDFDRKMATFLGLEHRKPTRNWVK